MFMDYLIMLIEGLATFISPCILPMIPIYITYFVGDRGENRGKAFVNSLGFVLGFSMVFIILAVFASVLGKYVNRYMNIIQILFGIMMIVLGLNFMEAINIKFLNMPSNIKVSTKNINFFRAMIFGILFSITWTPCVGSFLGTALMMVAKEGQLTKGVMMLLIYSIGLGIPFILCAILIDKLQNGFRVIKKHYNIIKVISGVLLIILGLYTIIK